jgi:hypothetical protein
MHPRGSSAQAGGRRRPRIGSAIVAGVLLALAAGCSSGTPSPHQAAVTVCGSGKTAAGVPVKIEVVQGNASCATAKTVERAYAKEIRLGRAPGNGGGGPLTIMGWTCQGFATPIVDQTGQASKCSRGHDKILEILNLPTPTSS